MGEILLQKPGREKYTRRKKVHVFLKKRKKRKEKKGRNGGGLGYLSTASLLVYKQAKPQTSNTHSALCFLSLSFIVVHLFCLRCSVSIRSSLRAWVAPFLSDPLFAKQITKLAMSNFGFSTPKSSSSSSASSSSPPSSSTFSLPLSDEDSLPYQKFACILVRGSRMVLEWYVFNISDDVEHNQAPPPPGPSPFLQAVFHPNSHEQPHIKPAVIVPPGMKCSVLGSNNTLYHIAGRSFCASGRDDLVSRFDLTNTKKSRQEFLPPMPNGILSSHALFLGNKLYCLGGYEENKPWAMAYDLSLDRWDSLVDPPDRPKNIDNSFSVALEVPTPTIVVGSTLQPSPLQIYDVHTKCWRRHEFINKDGFYLFPRGQPVAVDSKFYWYEFNYQCLAAFDVVTNEWSLAYVPIHDSHECLLDGEIDSPPRLAHLAGDDFCLFWGSPCQHYEPGAPLDRVTSRLHCLKFRISKVHPKQGSTFRLDASILSCQSYVVPDVKLFFDGFVGDGHLDLGYNCLEV